MAGMSFSTLHPDFRFGLLLVVAALFLNAGSSSIWGDTASGRLDLTSVQYGLRTAAGGLGALFAVTAAIWVDRCSPHGMMAAGAVFLALGPFLALSDSFELAVTRVFFAGVGGAFVGSVIFYAVAVKGCARFKGTLIGSLGLLFNMRWGTWSGRRMGDQHSPWVVGHCYGRRGRGIALSASPPLVHGTLWAWVDPQGDPVCSRGQA